MFLVFFLFELFELGTSRWLLKVFRLNFDGIADSVQRQRAAYCTYMCTVLCIYVPS